MPEAYCCKKCVHASVRRRFFLTSAICLRHRLHNEFKNGPWNEENGERPDDTEVESQAAGYFAMVSERFEMPLWIYEISHRSVRAVH